MGIGGSTYVFNIFCVFMLLLMIGWFLYVDLGISVAGDMLFRFAVCILPFSGCLGWVEPYLYLHL